MCKTSRKIKFHPVKPGRRCLVFNVPERLLKGSVARTKFLVIRCVPSIAGCTPRVTKMVKMRSALSPQIAGCPSAPRNPSRSPSPSLRDAERSKFCLFLFEEQKFLSTTGPGKLRENCSSTKSNTRIWFGKL